jgi:hypothetical protein
MQTMRLSRRAYARHRDVSESAVRKAIATGRITVEPNGRIDPEKADRDWSSRSDPSQQRDENRPVVLGRAEKKPQHTMTLLQARIANEVIKAEERSIRLAKIKGELVDRSRAVATVFALARRERDAWVQWPARVAALIAAELQVDPHLMETVLEKHVRQHLAALSNIEVELK